MFETFQAKRAAAIFFPVIAVLFSSACTVVPNSGPSTGKIVKSSSKAFDTSAIRVVDVSVDAAQRAIAAHPAPSFAHELGDGQVTGSVVGYGDVLTVTIVEAPPAMLFGGGGAPATAAAAVSSALSPNGARSAEIPEQMVSADGAIRVPFVGQVMAAGRTTNAISAEIERRLHGLAHDPQVMVRTTRNAASNVTIVGDVTNSVRMPLTAKGERLLDALAAGGGVKQPIGKMTIQVTRGSRVEAMPLEAVIRDPRQNIRLQSDDVVTLLFQPYSFTVLGAAKANQEIPFEGTGLTLSQALGRMGGLDDQRANPRGVFIFRFEDPKSVAADGRPLPPLTKDGKLPVIYRVNMNDPSTLFIAQSFPIRDKDVVFISNAPLADFSKFLQAVSQVVYPIATIQNTNIF